MTGSRFAVLATGPSLTVEQCEAVRHLRVVAVSDAYRLAPWAEALASSDAAWWNAHKPVFHGERYSAGRVDGCKRIDGIAGGLNSGVLGIRVARSRGAREIILLGFDGHGTHFFGKHPEGLSNTTDARRKMHMEQHRQEAHACKWQGVDVWNCTPGTVIHWYPKATLGGVL